MSILDKAVAAMTPMESDQDRAEARTTATQAAQPGDWLSMILDHHRQLEASFAQARAGNDPAARTTALKQLMILFTAHGGAEESVIYPALADTHQKAHAEMAYNEQAMAKIQFALMEKLDPMSQEWLDKLEHIEGAVLHHVYQEEGTWFPELARDGVELSGMLTQRYTEEFQRYFGGGSQGSGQHSGMQSGQGSSMLGEDPVQRPIMAR